MKVSIGEVSTFLGCRQVWDYTSRNRQHLDPVRPKRALFLGKGVHYALEQFYRNEADPIVAYKAWVEEQCTYLAEADVLDESAKDIEYALNMGVGMLAGYLIHYGVTPRHDKDGVRVIASAVEQQFDVPIPGTTDGRFIGTIDCVLRDLDGRCWIGEHKTFTTQPKSDALLLRRQTVGYTAALQVSIDEGLLEDKGLPPGTKVYGSLFNGLRKALPSSRSRADTQYFVREWIRRSEVEQRLFWKWLLQVYTEMANPDIAIYPSPNDNCTWMCAFREPCMARLNGLDDEWLLDHLFQTGEDRGEVYAVEDEG